MSSLFARLAACGTFGLIVLALAGPEDAAVADTEAVPRASVPADARIASPVAYPPAAPADASPAANPPSPSTPAARLPART